jgi:hypothetical protein
MIEILASAARKLWWEYMEERECLNSFDMAEIGRLGIRNDGHDGS